MWWKRYEPLLDARPVPVREALIDLIAKELAEMCETFPPPEGIVEWQDEHLRRRLEGRLAELPKIDGAMADLVSKLIALDLAHEIEAIDHLFRNEGFRDACPSEAHLDAVKLCWRAGLEVLYQRKDELPDHLRRADLIEIAERFPLRYRRRLIQVA